jgi:hypothetical protein
MLILASAQFVMVLDSSVMNVDQAELDASLGAQVQRGRSPPDEAAHLGANCWLRESMCQIAWVSRGAMPI